jgi:hypothetical protein
MKAKIPEQGWASCTWEGALEDVLRLGRGMTLREKILWLEQAAKLSLVLEEGKRKPPKRHFRQLHDVRLCRRRVADGEPFCALHGGLRCLIFHAQVRAASSVVELRNRHLGRFSYDA